MAKPVAVSESGELDLSDRTNPAITLASALATTAGGVKAVGIGAAGVGTVGLGLYFGSGAPTISAAQGSVYIRTDGSSTSTRLYINTTGSTTWTAVTTAA